MRWTDYYSFYYNSFLSTLKGKVLVEGAAFTGMMRQLETLFGIAIITTFIARFNQEHRVSLGFKSRQNFFF
jgi:hypothetical protein